MATGRQTSKPIAVPTSKVPMAAMSTGLLIMVARATTIVTGRIGKIAADGTEARRICARVLHIFFDTQKRTKPHVNSAGATTRHIRKSRANR